MAHDQKKAPQRRSKPSWFFSCFGFPRKAEGKKGRKSGGRKKFFRMCLPKIRVVNIITRKKVSLDEKAAAIKATQSIMLEASKVHQLNKLRNHALISPQDQLKVLAKETESVQSHNGVQPVQSDDDDAACDKQSRQTSKAKQTPCSTASNVTKDSLMGVSIMLATLIIMGVCGKLCAILCMSVWFYCVPLVHATKSINEAPRERETTKTNLGQEQCKKRVVLGELIQRDHKVAHIGTS